MALRMVCEGCRAPGERGLAQQIQFVNRRFGGFLKLQAGLSYSYAHRYNPSLLEAKYSRSELP